MTSTGRILSSLADALTLAIGWETEANIAAIATAFDAVYATQHDDNKGGIKVHLRTPKAYWTEWSPSAAGAVSIAQHASSDDGEHVRAAFDSLSGL